MYLQNTWVVYGQVMEVILPKVVLPRIWAMSPEIKIKLPDFFLSFVKHQNGIILEAAEGTN